MGQWWNPRRDAFLFHKLMFVQPRNAIAGPGMMIAEADSVRAFFINMKIVTNSSLLESQNKLQRVFDFDSGVFPGVPNETWRSVFSHLQLIGETLHEFGDRVFAQ